MKVTFLGHAALLIEGKNIKALIDPFLTGNPLYKPNPSDREGITHIFITHAHQDHIGDAIEIAKQNDSLIITNAELAGIFQKKHQGLKLHPMHIGGAFTFPFGCVKMTPALHGSGYRDGDIIQDGGNPAGFIITVGKKKIYHAGDTGLTMDMQLLYPEEIDVAFLPIGGNYTMDIDDAIRAAQFISAEIVVPIHYDTFPIIKANPKEFRRKLQDYQVKILNPGDSIKI